MVRNLVPIKVKIGLRENGQAQYPDFNLLPSVGGVDWSKYVDINGLGWHYDKTCGHREDSVDSPFGMQWGVLIVPREFANEAIARFPEEVTKFTELELEDFYDNKAHAHEPDEHIQDQVLAVFELIEKNGGTLTQEQQERRARALDPNDPEPGVRRNKKKRWAENKIEAGVIIVQ